MIKVLLLILVSSISFYSYTQNNVGIGTLTPNPNAALEIQSIDKGLLIPRITTAQRGIFGAGLTNTENSMLVYDVNDSIFYYWKATVWIPIPGINSDDQNIDSVILNPTDSILTVYIEDGLSASVDLKSAFDNTDEQTLNIVGDSLEISNGNSVLFIDNDTTNEKIDSVTYENDTLTVYEGDGSYKTFIGNLDEQVLNIVGDSLEISNGNSVLFIDNDTTNEKIDSVTYENDTLTVYEGDSIYKTEIIGGEWSDADKIGLTNFVYAKQALNNGTQDTVVVTDDGFLGVGIANPDEKIQVDGNIRIGRITDGGAVQPPGPGNVLYFSGGPDVSGIFDTDNSDWIGMGRFNLGTDVSELRIRLGDNQGVANNDGFVIGSASIGVHPWNEYFRVQSNGFVHIGTSALPAYPTNQLHLQGEINPLRIEGIQAGASTDSILTIDATGVIRKIPNSVKGEWNDADSIGMNGFIYAKQALTIGAADTVVVTDNGYLGVANGNPGTTLNVGDAFNPGTGFKAISIAGDGVGETRGAKLFMGADQTNFTQQIYQTTGTFPTFRLNQTVAGTLVDDYQFVVSGNGNVGVGTLTPPAKLTVNDTNVTIFMAAYNGAGKQGISSDGDLFLGGEKDTYIVSDMNAGAALGDIIFGDRILGYTPDNAKNWVLDDEHMRIDGVTGDVGIGTPDPSVKLDVVGDVSIGKHYDYTNTGGAVINDTYGDKLFFSGIAQNSDNIYFSRYNVSSDVSELRLMLGDNEGTANNDAFVIGSGSSGVHSWNEYFRVQSNGFVHIGTSLAAAYPTNQLHIEGGTNPLRLEGVQNGVTTDSVLSINTTGVVRKVEQVFLPPGMISPFATLAAPTGWLIADGSAVSRTTYANLFAAIGTMYGPGDGATTFNLPDYRGQFLRGVSGASGNDPNAGTRTNRGDGTTGNNVGTKQQDDFETHNHQLKTSSGTAGVDITLVDGPLNDGIGWEQTASNPTPFAGAPDAITYNRGGSETRPTNVSVNYCIKF